MNKHVDIATLKPRPLASRGRTINLALQGGGAHGAFTWGVLDRLLEEETIAFEGISATSAGAMNATVMAYGTTVGGRDGATAALVALPAQSAQPATAAARGSGRFRAAQPRLGHQAIPVGDERQDLQGPDLHLRRGDGGRGASLGLSPFHVAGRRD